MADTPIVVDDFEHGAHEIDESDLPIEFWIMIGLPPISKVDI